MQINCMGVKVINEVSYFFNTVLNRPYALISCDVIVTNFYVSSSSTCFGETQEYFILNFLDFINLLRRSKGSVNHKDIDMKIVMLF